MNYKDAPEGLPIADASYLRELFVDLKKMVENADLSREEARRLLFAGSLVGYYDCMWEGMNANVGHILYRLSDLLDEGDRRCMKIYPSPTGSIIDPASGQWDSLEDWRHEWERTNPFIPEFDISKKIEARQLLRLPETTSRP